MGASSRWPAKAWGEKRIKEFIGKASKDGLLLRTHKSSAHRNDEICQVVSCMILNMVATLSIAQPCLVVCLKVKLKRKHWKTLRKLFVGI